MPAPLSSTLISMQEPTRDSVTATRPPRGVNLIAFDSRFQMTCCRRLGSPEIGPADGSTSSTRRMLLDSAEGRTESIAALITVARSVG
jgi:hypothetical protein